MSTQAEFGLPVMQFTKDSTHTTFTVEYGIDNDDIVFHFFATPEHHTVDYWKEVFPNTLSEVATELFNASYPRLKAAYTEEVDSWWMRASGFANVGDPKMRIQRFIERLDDALDKKLSTVAR